MSYAGLYTGRVRQSEPLTKDQVRNNASGYVFTLDIWKRLRRFLILGSDSNTYYQNAKDLTKENAEVVKQCWEEDPERTAVLISTISEAGLAPKQDPGIFALALGAVHPNTRARQATYAVVPDVCRTASTLFQWIYYAKHLGKGTGRGVKRTISKWYRKFDTNGLAYQAIKYRNRSGYTHKRLIEFCHQGAGKDDLLREHLYLWMRGKEAPEGGTGMLSLPPIVSAHAEAMTLLDCRKSVNRLVDLVTTHRLPWEALPTWALTKSEVWEALVPSMGLTALIRNLGNMTHYGAIGPQKFRHVTSKLNKTAVQKSRVHPFQVLLALNAYRMGRPQKATVYRRSSTEPTKTWNAIPQVIDALNDAFYWAFKNVEPTNKRLLLALDVSGSMGSYIMNTAITAREASAAMALITMATEPNWTVVGFTTARGTGGGWNRWDRANDLLTPLDISPKQRLDDVVKKISDLPFGGTDCALPYVWAKEQKLHFDAVVTYTDSETWHGDIHPVQALREYRQYSGIPTKGIVAGMTATSFTIADPNDPGMLDIVGLDASIPTLISNFIRE